MATAKAQTGVGISCIVSSGVNYRASRRLENAYVVIDIKPSLEYKWLPIMHAMDVAVEVGRLGVRHVCTSKTETSAERRGKMRVETSARPKVRSTKHDTVQRSSNKRKVSH